MRRFEIVAVIGAGTDTDPIRPDVVGPYVVIATRGNRCLVKRPVADGAAATSGTVADLYGDEDDVRLGSLTLAQRTTIKTWLLTQGFPQAAIDLFDADGVANRRAFARYALRRLFQLSDAEMSLATALRGFDVAEAS